MKTVICTVCGRAFEVSDHTRRVKYCPPCGREMKNKKKRITRTENRSGAWKALQTLDTPENIQKCLCCLLPECRTGTGKCQIYKAENFNEVEKLV